MPLKDPIKRKEYQDKYRAKNKDQQREYDAKRYQNNKETKQESDAKRYEERKQHAMKSIINGSIIDRRKWDIWCNVIKRGATKNKHPYSDDFTNEIMFDMMVRGCFYCGDIATTIDRIDSKIEHTLDNCVGCCHGCNMSKGAADLSTFVRKAYYRAREKYFDDDIDIWFVNKTKPYICHYKRDAKKKGVSFELCETEWNELIANDCAYCNRSPTTWFGVDRVIPSLGYIVGNVTSCCYDCNLDKLEGDVESMMKRNERIARRVDSGVLVINKSDKVVLHHGTQPSTNKVCVYGNVYDNMSSASSELKMYNSYVSKCITRKKYVDDIFEISEDFYEFATNNKLKNITKKMYILFDRM